MSYVIISDYDETITSIDTISTLANLPYLYKDFPIPWTHFTGKYAQALENFQAPARTLPLLKPRMVITAANYYDLFQSELSYQDSLRGRELSSINELEKTGAFEGISLEQIQKFASAKAQLVRQDFMPAWKDASEVHILSINWCQEFIKTTLESAAAMHGYSENLPIPTVYCNALLSDNNKLNGKFKKSILTGFDKVKKLEQLLKGLKNDTSVWYVGDSETDLLSALYPSIHGALLLDPTVSDKKFLKIAGILGLDPDNTKKYTTDVNIQSLEIPCKQKGSLYLVKSWKTLARLMKK